MRYPWSNKFRQTAALKQPTQSVSLTVDNPELSVPNDDENYILKTHGISLGEIRTNDNEYELNKYENFPIGKSVIYNNIPEFLENIDIGDKDNCIIYLLNWGCGMGSALSVFAQNSYYLLSINPKLHVLPDFCVNGGSFKYHEESLNNSFFKYFKYLRDIDNTTAHDIYFVKSVLLPDIIFFEREQPPLEQVNSKILISHFRENFQLRIGNKVRNLISEIGRAHV
jgi:hypothetical protein